MRIAQISPLYESVPPQLYGGTERVVHFLTEELVRQGHDVTLFASGDSVTEAELVPVCPHSLRLDPDSVDAMAHHLLMLEQVFRPADEEEADSTRCNPKSLPESAFDNDSSLFLWRTLPFEEGLEVQYTASIPNRRDSRIVTLVVREVEQIETPAGAFDAWHVFVLAEGQSHDAWFEVDAPHRMVRYDNDQQVFLLIGESEADANPSLPGGVSENCE